jgi:hypothetical protein
VTEISKKEAAASLEKRRRVLKERFAMYGKCVDEEGKRLSPGASSVSRSQTYRDIAITALVSELIAYAAEPEIILSGLAAEGLAKLADPYERHRMRRQSRAV